MNGLPGFEARIPLLCAAALVLLSACRGVPTTRYYVLEPRAVVAGEPARSADDGVEPDGLVIGVLPFHVDPPYDQDRIVYRIGANSPEVGFYEYHRWAAPLSRMLPRIVAGAFREVSGIRRIEPLTPDREYHARLLGTVLGFEEIDSAAGQHVRVRLSLALVGADGTEIWSDLVAGESDTSADTVEAVVEQMRSVLEKVLAGYRDPIAGALAER